MQELLLNQKFNCKGKIKGFFSFLLFIYTYISDRLIRFQVFALARGTSAEHVDFSSCRQGLASLIFGITLQKVSRQKNRLNNSQSTNIQK
jgi:hypothetical protein